MTGTLEAHIDSQPTPSRPPSDFIPLPDVLGSEYSNVDNTNIEALEALSCMPYYQAVDVHGVPSYARLTMSIEDIRNVVEFMRIVCMTFIHSSIYWMINP